MEADDVVAEDARVNLLPDPCRQHAPGVGLGPGDVDEVVQEGVRAGASHHARQRVEVVVVDHHDRALLALDLLDHRASEVFVDGVVAELKRLDLLAPDVGRVGEIPKVMLDEPQHRVGKDVVEAVVGLRVGGPPGAPRTRRRRGSAPGRRARRGSGRPRRRAHSSPRRSRSPRGGRQGRSALSRGRRCRAAPRHSPWKVTGPRFETSTSGEAGRCGSGAAGSSAVPGAKFRFSSPARVRRRFSGSRAGSAA